MSGNTDVENYIPANVLKRQRSPWQEAELPWWECSIWTELTSWDDSSGLNGLEIEWCKSELWSKWHLTCREGHNLHTKCTYVYFQAYKGWLSVKRLLNSRETDATQIRSNTWIKRIYLRSTLSLLIVALLHINQRKLTCSTVSTKDTWQNDWSQGFRLCDQEELPYCDTCVKVPYQSHKFVHPCCSRYYSWLWFKTIWHF